MSASRENEVAKDVVDAALAVHRALGPGLLENAYESCLAIELEERGRNAVRQKPLPIVYRGQAVEPGYRVDVLVDGLVVVEVKAVDRLTDVHTAQTLSYLRLGDFRLGLLINFNVSRIRDGIRRLANGLNEETT